MTLPEIDSLWNRQDPIESEARFQKTLDDPETSDDANYRHQLLTQLARAQGLQRRFDDAHQTLDRVESRLAELDAETHVRYWLERGRVHNSSGNSHDAIPLFQQAWQKASDAALDFYAIDAAHMLAFVEPATDAQIDWYGKAIAVVQSTQDDRAKSWHGSLANNYAWTLHDAGRYEDALPVFQDAQTWFEQNGKPHTQRIARWSVARALRSLQRYDEALTIQRALLAEHNAAGSSDGFVQEEIAENLLAQGHDNEAQSHFKAAYDLLSQDGWLTANEPERIARLKRLADGSNAT